jgi:O-antigen ligase
MYLSLALLLLSTIRGGPVGDAVTLLWLGSVAVLAFLNAGAAFGLYIAAVALYGILHFSGWGSMFERPDNYALPLLLGGLTWRILVRRSRLWDRSAVVIAVFLAYGLLQGVWLGIMDRLTFAWYMRMFGLPLVMFLLLSRFGFEARELRALVRCLFVLGAYMALVSIVEQLGWRGHVLPTWLADPTLDAFMLRSGRSGGLVMQPEWNALCLSLIYILTILSARLLDPATRKAAMVVGGLCLIGIFFTYTRAAWIGTTFASLLLLLRPGANQAATRIRRVAVAGGLALFLMAVALARGSRAQARVTDSNEVFFRFKLWMVGVQMAKEHPVLGTGFATFGSTLASNLSHYQSALDVVGPWMKIADSPVHNTMLDVQVELGAIGVVLYVAVLLSVFHDARTSMARRWGREGVVWVLAFAGSYFIQVQFANAHEPTSNQILYGVMGVLAGLGVPGPAARRALGA